uniref:Uncharacterized protein n=1 Tax=Glossina austeni TaxID=7395 RepID=A0A1A9UZW9_GLOAU
MLMRLYATDIECAQVGMNIVDTLKHGNEALKKMHATGDVNEIERIMNETREGNKKLTLELDALVAEEEAENLKLSEVPQDERSLPSADETLKESKTAITEKPKKILTQS